MHKLKLELEALRVESFETTRDEGGRGTVQIHLRLSDYGTCPPVEPQPYVTENPADCPATAYDYTCAASCNGTCNSCYGTCVSCNGTCYGSCQYTCYNSCNVCEPVPYDP